MNPVDLVAFHKGWFGKDPEHTPKSLWVLPPQQRLYNAFPEARGFSSSDEDISLLLGALIVALAQTKPKSTQRVLLLVPKVHTRWVLVQMKAVARYLIRARKHNPESVELVRNVFGQVFLYGTPHKQPDEPARWASFGFRKDDPLIPQWCRDGLLEADDG